MRDVETTLAEMREFLPVASKDDEQRVRDLTERDIKRTLRDVRIPTSSSVESSRSGRSPRRRRMGVVARVARCVG